MITLDDMLVLKEAVWPHVTFYDKQVEVIESVLLDGETYVPACNKGGKDFIAGFIVVGAAAICTIRNIQFKILTSSATEKHLGNLWGEIDFFMRTAKHPLTAARGGQLVYQAGGQYITRVGEEGLLEKNNYVMAAVVTSEHKGEGLSGHHAAWTLFVGDEVSGMANVAHSMAQGWAKHMLFIGNCNPCGNQHFWRKGIRGGRLVA